MSIKLLPPGTRHGNRDYYVRISVKGRRVEISTGTSDKRLAKRFAEQREKELYESCVLGRSEGTVTVAIDNYIAFRRPTMRDEGYLFKIRGLIGRRKLPGVGQQDFDECARVLYPGLANETWNRCVYTPLQAALRHAGLNLLIKRPKQKKPKHKSITARQRNLLIKNAIAADDGKPDLKALLTLLFFNGPRISEAISLTRAMTDLQRGIACFDVTKVDDDDGWRPLHPKVVAALANLPKRKDGRWFRWETRSGPSKRIKALREKMGIYFSAHTGRHTFGDQIVEKGGDVRELLDTGNWSDIKSAMRYTTRNVERARKVINKL